MDAISRAGLRVAVLIKQVPTIDSLRLGEDGRLVRSGQCLEINPFCRRAITLGVALAREGSGRCTVFSLAPASGESALREAIAAGADSGVLISDPQFAGSDTLATARALAAAIRLEGAFDLVVCGRNSVDADTGQIGPEVAALLDMPFVVNAREVKVVQGELFAKSEREDGWSLIRAKLPAVLSAAERSCAPARADAVKFSAVPSALIRTVDAASLGPGPWGHRGSPTRVQEVRAQAPSRRGTRLAGSLAQQVIEAVRFLSSNRESDCDPADRTIRLAARNRSKLNSSPVAVILEPGRVRAARTLCATASRLARELGTTAAGLISADGSDWPIRSWGLDHVVTIRGARIEEDVARAAANWATAHRPTIVLTSGSLWGREVAGRVAAWLGVGLIGDAIGITVSDGRIVVRKPAFGGNLEASITTDSSPQMATLRPANITVDGREPRSATSSSIDVTATDRITILKTICEDDAETLLAAQAIVGVGMGVSREDYPLLTPLLDVLRAPLACTRKVADRGWLPRTRQVGLTGCHVAPHLYVAIGLRGNSNHVVGIRKARIVLAINSDPDAPIFSQADIGIVGDWREAVKLLTRQIAGSGPEPWIKPRLEGIDARA